MKFLEVKIKLIPDQEDTWDKMKDAITDIQTKEKVHLKNIKQKMDNG